MLFQTVCSEVDVVGKEIAKIADNSFHPGEKTGINEWWYHIQQAFPDLKERKCVLLGGYDLYPWKNYSVIENPTPGAKKYILDSSCRPKAKTPSWWSDYNSVKHSRTGKFEKHSTNYAKANLKNLFNAFAGLFSLDVLMAEQAFTSGDKTVGEDLQGSLFEETPSFYTVVLSLN